MPEVRISIGGRAFEVSCQEGEEHYLQSAAALLDTEASALAGQVGRITETRMLLMAGLMLADKTAGIEEQLRGLQEKLSAQEALIEELRNRPAPEADRVEVPVIPEDLVNSMAEIAARAEAMASDIEDRSS